MTLKNTTKSGKVLEKSGVKV